MLKSALLTGAGVVIGAGAIQGLHAAGGGAVYTVYEANVKDEAGYTKDLPEVGAIIKANHGTRIAGGFQKAKATMGAAAGNRYVIVKFDSAADNDAFWEKGGRRTRNTRLTLAISLSRPNNHKSHAS